MNAGSEEDAARLAMARLFLQVPVVVPSRGDPAVVGGFSPLTIDHEGTTCIVSLVSNVALERAQEVAPFALEMTGAQLVETLNAEVGVVVDNGSGSFVLTPNLIRYLQSPEASR